MSTRLNDKNALEWLIDPYQVREGKRSGIKSELNREDDEEYIVRLVAQVVRESTPEALQRLAGR